MTDPTTPTWRLVPCPHCGLAHTLELTTAQALAEQDSDYDGDFWEHSESWAVICNASRPDGPGGCGASGGFFPTEQEAVDAWNRRASPAPQELPPVQLPEPDTHCFDDDTGNNVWSYSAELVLAAIAADRLACAKARGE